VDEDSLHGGPLTARLFRLCRQTSSTPR
jgi:hypothetical protein